jgi:hypothetical protein
MDQLSRESFLQHGTLTPQLPYCVVIEIKQPEKFEKGVIQIVAEMLAVRANKYVLIVLFLGLLYLLILLIVMFLSMVSYLMATCGNSFGLREMFCSSPQFTDRQS